MSQDLEQVLIREVEQEWDKKIQLVIILKNLVEDIGYNDIANTVERVSTIDHDAGYLSTKYDYAIISLQSSKGIPRAKTEIMKAKLGTVLNLYALYPEELNPAASYITYAEVIEYEADEGLSTLEIECLIKFEYKWIMLKSAKGGFMVNFFTREHMKAWINTTQKLSGKELKKQESYINNQTDLKLFIKNFPIW